MSGQKVTRRRFLRGLAAVAGGTVLAACTPQVVEKVVDRPVVQTVVVEKAVEVEKVATVVVEKAVEVEKRVVETVVVEKAVEIEKRVVETVVVDRPVEVEKKVVETVIVEKEKVVEKLVTAVPEAKAEPLDLRIKTNGGDVWGNFTKAQTDLYEERTGHKFFIQQAGDVEAEIAAGTPPDVFHTMTHQAYPTLVGMGQILELNDALIAAGFGQDDLARAAWEMIDFFSLGKIYGMPLFLGASSVWHGIYRKDFFDEAGIPLIEDGSKPWETYEDMMEVAKELVKRDASGEVVQWGFELAWGYVAVIAGMWDRGLDTWDPDKKQFTLDQPGIVDVIQTMLFDPIWTHGVSPNEAQGVLAWNDIRNGLVAIEAIDYPLIAAIESGSDEDAEFAEVVGYFELPGMAPGKHGVAQGGTWISCVPSSIQDAHKKAATEFTALILETEMARMTLNIIHAGSSLKEFRYDPVFNIDRLKDKAAEARANEWVFAVTSDESRHWGWHWGQQIEGSQWLGGQVARAQSGEATAEQLAAEWQENAQLARDEFFESTGMEPM